jgi:hypothetical protein
MDLLAGLCSVWSLLSLGWGTGTGSPWGRGRDGAADIWTPNKEIVVNFAFAHEIDLIGDLLTIRPAAVPA